MAQRFSPGVGRSFNADVLKRILSVLHQEGPTKKTNLAGKTRLNYLTCVKYLELLKSLGLVELVKGEKVHEGGERISINQQGLRFSASLSAFLKRNYTNAMPYLSAADNNLQSLPLEVDGSDNKMSMNKKIKIMLVDDDQDTLFTYKLFLAGTGYDVHVFSNPVEALNHLALFASSYQLVITDIRMSTLNGLQLFHEIKALNPNIRVMFISALDATDELVSILPGLQKDLVLRKPIDRVSFIKALNRAFQYSERSANSVNPLVTS
jgi:CheY-like chemotaxis protein/predicted transcriptional regulator